MKVSEPLPDIQGQNDDRGINIPGVGVSNVRMPINVMRPATAPVNTIASIDFTVSLPKQFKGTHMSRFLEILQETPQDVKWISRWVLECLNISLERLNALEACMKVKFPYWIETQAPVTKKPAPVVIDCELIGRAVVGGSADGDAFQTIIGEPRIKFYLTVATTTTATSLCPCSKEISNRGAHNQRSKIRIAVAARNEHSILFEDLHKIAVASASCEIFNLLKRADEKWVTEVAYDQPRFVEDIARNAFEYLWAYVSAEDHNDKASQFSITVHNEESIHQHDAIAWINHPDDVHLK